MSNINIKKNHRHHAAPPYDYPKVLDGFRKKGDASHQAPNDLPAPLGRQAGPGKRSKPARCRRSKGGPLSHILCGPGTGPSMDWRAADMNMDVSDGVAGVGSIINSKAIGKNCQNSGIQKRRNKKLIFRKRQDNILPDKCSQRE
jgi:hypothetical protein